MPRRARPTLRLLSEDLTDDWENVDDRRAVAGGLPSYDRSLDDLRHPLIQHTAGQWDGSEASADVKRESISGLTDPPWWKAKTGRWRGAVWEDPDTGQAWLCAAGLRREGELTDFYKTFMADVLRSGPERFLPTEDDRTRLALENGRASYDLWQFEIFEAVTAGVVEAALADGKAIEVVIPSPYDETPLGSLFVEVDRIVDDDEWDADAPAEIAIRLEISRWDDPDSLTAAQVCACSAIAPQESDWDAAPSSLGVRLMVMIDEARLRAIIASAHLEPAELREIAEPGAVAPLSHAHYAPQRNLARASIEGSPVHALCGLVFVPRQDHLGKPVCDDCEDTYTRICEVRREQAAD